MLLDWPYDRGDFVIAAIFGATAAVLFVLTIDRPFYGEFSVSLAPLQHASETMRSRT
jgi:hypothetical protein